MTVVKPIPDREYLIECVELDTQAGSLLWKRRPVSHFKSKRAYSTWNSRYAGKPAFRTPNGRGYLVGCLDYQSLFAHRVIYTLVYGEVGDGQIDHINGDRTDNRPSNLRLVTPLENRRNAAIPRTNKSGVVGVSFRPDKGRWRACINVSDKSKHLGYFSTIEEAVSARRSAEKLLGFHPNHGRGQC